jgi:hypothetical protein
MFTIGHRSTSWGVSRPRRPSGYDHLVTRDDYRRRIAELRPLIATFRGPLEHSGCGGSNGSISERTPDGKEWHVGGAVTEEGARAIVAAVNLVRDLCSREEAGQGPT